jgi:hypothetical protein
MSRKFKSKIFRKPSHWTEQRYEEFLKEKGYFKSNDKLKDKKE